MLKKCPPDEPAFKAVVTQLLEQQTQFEDWLVQLRSSGGASEGNPALVDEVACALQVQGSAGSLHVVLTPRPPCQRNSRCCFRQLLELSCCSRKGRGRGYNIIPRDYVVIVVA